MFQHANVSRINTINLCGLYVRENIPVKFVGSQLHMKVQLAAHVNTSIFLPHQPSKAVDPHHVHHCFFPHKTVSFCVYHMGIPPNLQANTPSQSKRLNPSSVGRRLGSPSRRRRPSLLSIILFRVAC